MSEKEFNAIFSQRLRYFLELHDMTQVELAKRLGVGTTSVSNWINGTKTPRMDKVDAICAIFGIRRKDLMEEPEDSDQERYYIDDETAKVAQEIFENPDLKILFDAARDVDPDDLRKAAQMLRVWKGEV
ncbi:MAG: helix-turn-helix transcriptional regulator [Lachnospiraceae bacterium]|nr:helix-turn-helix transcriptional regulator [Lachnospiraceae bacterium]